MAEEFFSAAGAMPTTGRELAESNTVRTPFLPAYPEGEVVGPCVCGSWPGGKCLRCPAMPQHVKATLRTDN